MYHLLSGLHSYLTRKDEYSVVIIGLDNVRILLSFALQKSLTFAGREDGTFSVGHGLRNSAFEGS